MIILSRILTFLLGFIAIGLIVFLHELGHYFSARLLKVDVECLSFGMGPKVISYYGKNTEFRLSLFPFGGYCKMKGSIDLEKALSDNKERIYHKEEGSYFAVTPLKRILIYASGPLTNFLIAFTLLLAASIIPVERLSNDAYITPISEYENLFDQDIKQDGIKKGDLVLAVEGTRIRDYQEFRTLLTDQKRDLNLEVQREGEIVNVTIHPTLRDGKYSYGLTLIHEPIIGRSSDDRIKSGDRIIRVNGIDVFSTLDVYSLAGKDGYTLTLLREGKEYDYSSNGNTFPFSWDSTIVKRSDVPINKALSYSFKETFDFFFSTLEALGALITLNISDARTVITGPVNAAESIGTISTEAFSVSSQSGLRTLFYLLAIVSISLCIANILPIPTFDGGQILICLFEIFRHGNLKAKTYLILQVIGMIAAFLIMASMYFLDIKEYFF